jgi:thymidylate synthase (FAD)
MENKYVGNLTGMPFMISVVDSMGGKLTVVNAARSSFQKMHEEFDEVKDSKLMNFLAREEHTMPYRHCFLSLHVRVPEFVARQMFRHLVGCEYTFKDTAWSEMSGRYVSYDELYIPNKFHLQHPNKKQGSSEEISSKSDYYNSTASTLIQQLQQLYNEMITDNVAREQARIILPVGIYTEFRWTASLQAITHFVKLRSKLDAQREIRDVANVIHTLAKEIFGDAYNILYEHMVRD